ncbi:TetR/AcrR family transcriptional regulator [Deinococcus apachensis]|uniref:TetR/AcrR family transcriptional regulator n=1 Tax=Deinococcus apachensis TaxID=309886 RepID=UPI00037579DC|nr:TetR/AcrR family transcriptional regulator [Deinococcus apachensis]
MVIQTRARTPESKLERRGRILDEALTLWQERRYPDVTLADIAARVGLTKPALFAYFATKEELFLSLYERLLGEWFDALDRHLRLGGTHTPPSLATLLATLITERPALARLIPLLAGLLEHNVSATRAAEHKTWVASRLAVTAPLLEAALPGLPGGSGPALLTYTQALVAGLQPLSEPSPAVREALATTGLGALHVDFAAALRESLTALLRGMVQTTEEGDR